MTSLTSVGIYATGLATGPILARVLGPAGRGDIAAVMAPATVLVLILAFGFPTAAAYFSTSVAEKRLLVTTTAFGVIVGAPVCAALWFVLPGYFRGHSDATLFWARVLLLSVPLSVGMAAAIEIQRWKHPGVRWNLWRSAPLLVPALAIIVLAIMGRLTVSTALAANFAGWMVPLAHLLLRLGRPSWPRPSIDTLRRMFPYAWRTASLGTAMSLTNRLDQVILVGLVAPGELGLYAVAVTAASITSPLTSGLASALLGQLRDETDEARAHAQFRRSLTTTIVVSGAVALALAVLAPLLLRVAFGSPFTPAATVLRLLVPGAVAFDVLTVITAKLFSEGRPGEASRAALVGAVLTVVGLVAFAPRYGIEGAAGVTSLSWGAQVTYLVKRGALRTHPGPALARGPGLGTPSDIMGPNA